ncbi:MAG: hypothetical protein M1839_005366 [Geoglossum umbratile]|nr:MAG: hypothetical protein M1839_005366 [Geoglossum umbratile]
MTQKKVAPSHVGEVKDGGIAKQLLNASLKGKIRHISRQPRNTDIQKGHVFISEENASGVKEWNDGFVWREIMPSEVESSEDKSYKDFKIHATAGIDGDLHRKMWTFQVNGLRHLVVAYCDADNGK